LRNKEKLKGNKEKKVEIKLTYLDVKRKIGYNNKRLRRIRVVIC